MHEYYKPGDYYREPIDWDRWFWKIFVFSTIACSAYIALLVTDASRIERMGLGKESTFNTGGYRQKELILDDGTQCVVITGGHSGRLGISCNWNWRG